MASKNLGAVIQRAISDGAFRRQLQSDPAAALRGFNLSPDEIAAIHSGDSSKLMSLGVDQRMSKAFSVGGATLATRSTVSDISAGGTASTIASDPTSGTREGIVGDPTSGSREALTTGTAGGTRAVNDVAPYEGNVHGSISDPTLSGTRAIHDSGGPVDLRGAVSTGGLEGTTRSVNDVAPFEGNVNAVSTGSQDLTRAVNDVAPFDGSGRGGSLAGDMSNVDNVAAAEAGRGGSLAAFPDSNAGASGNMISADDNYAVSSQMADANTAASIRGINDVAPFEGNVNATASSEFIPTDELRAMEHNVGGDATHNVVPSDSADVQREMLDGLHGGDALGHTGGGGNTGS